MWLSPTLDYYYLVYRPLLSLNINLTYQYVICMLLISEIYYLHYKSITDPVYLYQSYLD